MSYLERLRSKLSSEGARPEPSKPTKPGYVCFVGTPPAHSRQILAANDPEQVGPDLPLDAAQIEYHALIERLLCSEEERQVYRRMANGLSPEALVTDLPKLRDLVKRGSRPVANR